MKNNRHAHRHALKRWIFLALFAVLFAAGLALLCSEPCASDEDRWLRTFIVSKVVGMATIIASCLVLSKNS